MEGRSSRAKGVEARELLKAFLGPGDGLNFFQQSNYVQHTHNEK